MKSKVMVVCLLIGMFVYMGCGNAYLDPVRSKALSEERQEKLLEKQNSILERIAISLEKINKS